MKRAASAAWSGDLKLGKGSISTASGALRDTPYSFSSRFADAPSTNPEELICAAHAGCFTMACAAGLSKAGFVPRSLATTATITMDQVQGNWTITEVHLELRGQIPSIARDKFDEIVADAKANCPVSRVLNAKITLDAKLE